MCSRREAYGDLLTKENLLQYGLKLLHANIFEILLIYRKYYDYIYWYQWKRYADWLG